MQAYKRGEPYQHGLHSPATFFVALLLLASLVWGCGIEAPASNSAPVATTGTEDPADTPGGLAAYDANGDGIIFQSGMHPWVVQDEPGQCVVCGMDLQPVSVNGAAAGTVGIDPVTMQNLGVRTAPVTEQVLARTLRTTGTFEANERARTVVTLKVSGWVERLYVDAEGDRIRHGQPLLELYSPELVATQEEVLLALRARDLMASPEEGNRLVAAARRRLALFDVTEAQIDRLIETGEVQRTLTVYSPAGGTVVQKHVVGGMQAQAGVRLFEVVDLGHVWLKVDVPEADLGWVSVGTEVQIEVEAWPSEPLAGRVEYVYDTLDPATRTGTARVVVPNPNRRLKPGMYATAHLTGAATEPRLSVPAEAAIRTGEDAVVLIAETDETGSLSGRFRPQAVMLGTEGEAADGTPVVHILNGLDGTERVVTSAQFLIDSEARLAASLTAMTSDDAQSNAMGGMEMTEEMP
ncbi:MAG: efflux RND transporter periplasmic adaptor subunit [Bacteroidota bacterium]